MHSRESSICRSDVLHVCNFDCKTFKFSTRNEKIVKNDKVLKNEKRGKGELLTDNQLSVLPVIEQYVLVLMDYTGVNTDGGVRKDSGTTGSFRGKLGEQVEECAV